MTMPETQTWGMAENPYKANDGDWCSVDDVDQLEERIKELESELESKEDELSTAEVERDDLQVELDELKEKYNA